MGTIVRDLRIAVRTFARRPGFTLVAAGTLALGIGAHAALFSVVDGVLLEPVDLPRSDELVVARAEVDGELRNLTGPNAADLLREGDAVFRAAAAFWGASATVQNPDGTRETRSGVGATPGVFEALGVPLQLGRPWGPEAMGTGAVTDVVITDRYWRSRFGADTALVGGTLVLSGGPVRVTGVAAPGFAFPTLEAADFFFAPVTDPAALPRSGLGAFTLLGRLRPGVTPERAGEALRAAWEGIRERHPGDLLDHDLAVMGLQDYAVREVRPALLALLAATFLLLVLACANVANLVLARGLGRGREMSLRASLGAGRGRIVGQLLAEGAVLAGAAGLLGAGLAEAALAAVRALAPAEIPGMADAGLSLRAVAFALCVAAGCAVVVGLVPALRRPGRGLSSDLRGGARASAGPALRRLQGALVVAQVAAAVVLAVGAGLLVRSFAKLSGVDPGYRTEGVVTADVVAPTDVYVGRAARADFFRRIEAEVAALPGVTRVGTTLRPPFSTGELSVPVRLEDRPGMTLDGAPRVEIGIASSGYMDALDIPVLRGRAFADGDGADAPRVALVSAALARTLYGDENPVGRRLTPVLGSWEGSTDWAEIVGVVGDVRLQALDADAAGTLYLSTYQLPQTSGTVVARTSGDAAALPAPVREALLRVEPLMVAPTVRTLASLRAESLARPRFNSFLLGTFSILALILAAVGIYGMLAYAVAARRHELGVRAAFGAGRGRLLRLVLVEGMSLTALGLVLGAAAAAGLAGRGLSDLLFDVAPTDPATYGSTLLVVAAVALAGSALPALRAAGGDAVEALRGD